MMLSWQFDEPGPNLFPNINPVGSYHVLPFTNFNYAVSQHLRESTLGRCWRVPQRQGALAGTVGGLVPESNPNIAVASLQNDLVNSTEIVVQPYGTISTSPREHEYFHLVSGYFGCFQNQANPQLPGLALSCNVQITGNDYDGKQVGPDAITLNPSDSASPMTSIMQSFMLSFGHRELRTIAFSIVTSALLTAETNFGLDILKFCVPLIDRDISGHIQDDLRQPTL
jgi:hypothetical protein